MATYINTTNGDSEIAIWSLITKYQNSGVTVNALSGAYQSTIGVTGSSATIQGVIVQMAYILSSATGTMTVELYNNSTSSIIQSVTVNLSDILNDSSYTNNYGGWLFFRFNSNVTLNAVQSYSVRMIASTTSNIFFIRSSTAGNWNRGFVSAGMVQYSPGDDLLIGGVYGNSNIVTSYKVRYTNTSATQSVASIQVNQQGTFEMRSDAPNVLLNCSGNITIYANGTMSAGSQTSAVSSTNSVSIAFTGVTQSTNPFGIINSGVFTSFGSPKTGYYQLATTMATASNKFTLTDIPNWSVGDKVEVTSFHNHSRYEQFTISSISGADVTITGTASFIHGINNTTTEYTHAANLTRNVNIYGASATAPCFLQAVANRGTFDIQNTEMYYIGSNTPNRYGMSIDTPLANVTIVGSVIRDNTITNARMITTTGLNGGVVDIRNNVFYNIPYAVYLASASSVSSYINNISINSFLSLSSLLVDFSSNIIANSALGAPALSINDTTNEIYTFQDNTIYTSGIQALDILNAYGLIDGLKIYNSGTYNLIARGNVGAVNKSLRFNNLNTFGSNLANFSPREFTGTMILDNMTSKISSVNTTPTGLLAAPGYYVDGIIAHNCSFGPSHSTADMSIRAGGLVNVKMINCTFNSINKIEQTFYTPGFSNLSLNSTNENNVTNANYAYTKNGTSMADSVIYRSSNLSLRLIPLLTTFKLSHKPVRVAVRADGVCKIGVWVRVSVVGDGTAYTGNPPRLILRPSPQNGIYDYTLLDTHSGTSGVWEYMTSTLPTPVYDSVYEVCVDCDGQYGWINIDDWDIDNYYVDTKSLNYWIEGNPYVEIEATRKQVTSTFGS